MLERIGRLQNMSINEVVCDTVRYFISTFAVLALLAAVASADLIASDLINELHDGSNLTHSDLQGANLSRSHLNRSDLSYSNLQGADLSLSQMIGAD